jgi:regulation of enolase protein 1 (concanavalin A-like superfamily)
VFVSDDFNSCILDEGTGGWTFSDPLGLSSRRVVGAGTGEAWLEIAVSAGTAHNPWNASYTAPRVMRAVANSDFVLQVKFLSDVTVGQQMQGILIEQDAANYLRFDFHYNSGVRVFAASTTNGASSSRYTSAVIASTPRHMRITRQGNQWTQAYSFDGTTWTTAASFSHTLMAAKAGVFAGNAGSAPPTHTAKFDYVFNAASPIVPEDGGAVQSFTLTVSTSGNGTVTRNPDQPSYPCGSSVTLTAAPAAGWMFTGWSGDLTGNLNPAYIDTTRNKAVTASFAVNIPPALSNISLVPGDTWATASWQTDEPATTEIAYGLTPAYELGVLAQSTFVTQHSITLTGLNRETTYYVRLTSRDPDGGSSSSPNLTFTTTSAVPIEITSIQATVGETSTTISWLTNKPATSAVAHGLTQAYERGVVSDSSLKTTHAITLFALTPGTTYHYKILANDGAGLSAESGDRTFTTTSETPVITIWYGDPQRFGYLGTPQTWINVLGNVHDPDGVASLQYSLNGSAWRALSIGPDNQRLEAPGGFQHRVELCGSGARLQ